MNRLKSSFVISLLLCAAVSQALIAEEHIKLTPAWAKQNPGKLTMSMGSAFGGWNDYSFKLHFDTPKIYSVRSTVLLKRKREKGEVALHSFTWAAQEPTKVIPLNLQTPSYTSEYASDETDVSRADAKLSIVVKHLDSGGNPTGAHDEYYLRLSDFIDANLVHELQEGKTHSKPETEDGG